MNKDRLVHSVVKDYLNSKGLDSVLKVFERESASFLTLSKKELVEQLSLRKLLSLNMKRKKPLSNLLQLMVNEFSTNHSIKNLMQISRKPSPKYKCTAAQAEPKDQPKVVVRKGNQRCSSLGTVQPIKRMTSKQRHTQILKRKKR